MTPTKKPRDRRSEKLTNIEFAQFKKWVKSFDVKVEASEALRITRQAVDRILLTGSASPSTIIKIRKAISQEA